MFDIIHIYKSEYICFAGLKPHEEHNVYLSAYGPLASVLLERYVEDERADNEELFAEWDESVQKASSQVGFSATHETEDGYVYISSFQNGIGVSADDGTALKRNTPRREYDESEYYGDGYDEFDGES
ncbi:MAG: hypothetical protein ACYTFW_21810 [Planctomycetota bacterium]|jgi:hypothetical protein